MIRQDWLDNLGLEMPTTQEEFVEVLRAFKNDESEWKRRGRRDTDRRS